MNDLTERLSTGIHPVTIGNSQCSADELRRRLEKVGYVNVKFTETRGGTDLTVEVDLAASDLSAADFENGAGSVHIEGTLSLNYDPVRCIADIDLASLTGTGYLKLVGEPDGEL